MKAVILPLIFGLLLFVAMSALLRLVRPKEPARALLRLYLITLPVFIATFLLLPADLGCLPPQLIAPSLSIELGFAMFLYSAGFFGGLLQLYNLADRGLSLRILIDLLESPRGTMSAEELVEGYGGGHGITWMYRKRLEGIGYAGLASQRDDCLVLTERGRNMAKMFGFLQHFARFDGHGAGS